MATCIRCGDPTDEDSHGDYVYCDNCKELFKEVGENGVRVRSRHTNSEFHKYPYDAPKWKGRYPQNQTEALAAALDRMEERDCRGLFIYQKTGSRWLVSEYLEAHPSIAEDVEKLRNPEPGPGLLSRLLG